MSEVADPPRQGPPPIIPPGDLQGGPDPTPIDDEGWRCLPCGVTWPVEGRLFNLPFNINFNPRYGPECPVCKERTTYGSNLTPISLEEAWSLKNHADFERYFERRGPRDALTNEELMQYG